MLRSLKLNVTSINTIACDYQLQPTFVAKLVIVANDKLHAKTNRRKWMKYFFIKYVYGHHIMYT
jgi:hypothetical protein